MGVKKARNVIGDREAEISKQLAEVESKIQHNRTTAIPDLQAKLMQEEAILSTLGKSDALYKEQLEKVKGMKNGLETANTAVAGLLGQQSALKDLQSGQMKDLKDSLGHWKTWESSHRSLIDANNKILESSEKNLDVTKELKSSISDMGDNKKELVEGAKDIMDEYTNGFDNIQKGLQGAIDKIPLVGGMLNAMVKGPLDEAVSVAKIGLAQSFLDATKNAGGLSAGTVAIKAGFSGMATGLASVGKAMLGMLVNPIFLALSCVWCICCIACNCIQRTR